MSTAKENGKNAKPSVDDPRQLERFVRKVLRARDTPDLIRILAGDGALLSWCKTLAAIVPEKAPVLWQTYSAACRKHGADPVKIRERLAPAARSLGLWTRAEGQLDYYALLEVDAAASLDAIQKAYYQKAKTLHPDAQPAAGTDDAAFIRVNEAYTVLKDPVLRKHYDESRRSMDAWCEFPDCRFDDETAAARNRIVFQIGAVVAVLLVLTLVFGVVYESRSMKDGFRETVSSRAVNRPPVAPPAVPQGETAAPAAAKKDGVQPRQSSGGSAETPRTPPAGAGAAPLTGVKENPRAPTPAEAAIRAFYTRHKEVNPDHGATDPETPPVTRNKPAADRMPFSTAPAETAGEDAPAAPSTDGAAKAPAEDAILTGMMEATEAPPVPESPRKTRDTRLSGKTLIPDAQKTPADVEKTPAPAGTPSGQGAKPPKKESAPSGLSDTDALAMVNRLADSAENIERIKAFIRSYCAAYVKRDLEAFSRYFAKDAVENGKAFSEWAPDYRETFRSMETLEYEIRLRRFSHLIDKNRYRAEGIYRITWQVPGGKRRVGTGDITFDLVKEAGALRVKRLMYSEIRSSER